jgi:hypothetical protein
VQQNDYIVTHTKIWVQNSFLIDGFTVVCDALGEAVDAFGDEGRLVGRAFRYCDFDP